MVRYVVRKEKCWIKVSLTEYLNHLNMDLWYCDFWVEVKKLWKKYNVNGNEIRVLKEKLNTWKF